MAISYDETVIQAFAARLYRRAAVMAPLYTVIGGVLGFGAVFVSSSLGKVHLPSPGVTVFCGGIGALLGYAVGSERAFTLRLMAQTALCQVAIEHNTRRAAHSLIPVAPVAPPLMPHQVQQRR